MPVETAARNWAEADAEAHKLISVQDRVGGDRLIFEPCVVDAVLRRCDAEESLIATRAADIGQLKIKLHVAIALAAQEGALEADGPAMSLLASIEADMDAMTIPRPANGPRQSVSA